MTANQIQALRLLQPLYFDVYRLAGDSNKQTRKQVMELLTGTKMPVAKCGVTAIRETCWNLVPVQGDCMAARESDFEAKANAILEGIAA